MSKNRVEALSDGVFAIVMTLLILDIHLPEVEYSQLGAALVEAMPRVYAYAISFAVIGVYWLTHHQSLQLVGKLNTKLIMLNLLFLLAVSFMPFPTALLGRFPLQPIPILIYGLNLIAANAVGLVVTLYMRAHPDLSSGLVLRAGRKSMLMYAFVNTSYLVAMLLGFVAPLASYAIFVVVLATVIVYYGFTPVVAQPQPAQAN